MRRFDCFALTSPFRRIGAYLLILSLASGSSALVAQPQVAWPTQSNSQGGVTVKVTPKALAAESNRWDFAVVLDTHTQELGDDLTQTATLVTDDGLRLKPTAWSGAKPGGHHREGVLSFAAPEPRPSSFELQISRDGESAPRSFRWKR